MACGDVLSLEDLQTAKKHQIFEAEVITGKAGGVAGGASIDYATNQVTGQTQQTLPAVIADANADFDAQILNMGFTRVGTFAAGATLTNPRQTLLWDVANGGDGQEYGWSGAFPKVVPAASTPASTGGISVGAWISRFDPELRIQVREALRRSYADAGYNLVDGSFEVGGTLVSVNDVLLQERTGKAFTGPAGVVAAGTNPASGGFVDQSLSERKFISVSEMKKAPLVVGQIVWTISYYSDTARRAGGCRYLIAAGGTGVVDGGSVIQLDNGLQAIAFFDNNRINACQFGSKDGADSTINLYNLGQYLNAIGGGVTLEFNSGETYYYTNHKGPGDTSYYGGTFLFNLVNVKNLIIAGAGCTLKALAGSKYGSFDPTTGAVYNPTLPFNNPAYANSPGTVWNFDSCSNIVGFLPTGHGNNEQLSLGGRFGDSGRQLQATYLRITGASRDISLYDVRASYMGLDGISIKITTAENDTSHNVNIYNPVCEYNGRQGLSLVGGSHITFYNGKFNHTGTTQVSSAPTAGVDIEPEMGNFVISPRFIGGESINNAGVGLLWYDPGNRSVQAVFEDFEIWGCRNNALWCQGGSGHVFNRGKIHGKLIRVANIEFRDTLIDDMPHPIYGLYKSGLYIADNVESANSAFIRCKFKVTQYRGPLGGTFKNTEIDCGWDASNSATGGTAMSLASMEGVTVIDNLTGAFDDTNRFFIADGGSNAIYGTNALTIVGTGNGIRYGSKTGEWGEIPVSSYKGVGSITMKSAATGASVRILGMRSSAPTGTSTTYSVGDIFYKINPAAGGSLGWVCVTAGAPGVWKTWGAISA